jgi:diguanylate cyclase (GGDEF)-like protein
MFAPVMSFKYIFWAGMLLVSISLYFAKSRIESNSKKDGNDNDENCTPADSLNPDDLLDENKRLKDFSQKLQSLVEEQTGQLEKVNRRLRKLENTDEITGIPNFRQFMDLIDLEWRRSLRHNRLISLLVLNIDGFSQYNKEYGQECGDLCLRRIAKMLIEIIKRPGDVTARYDKGDFIVLLAETDKKNAADIAEMLRVGVEFMNIPQAKSLKSPIITVSIGCASHHPKKGDTYMALIAAADEAVKKAKTAGGNRLALASAIHPPLEKK